MLMRKGVRGSVCVWERGGGVLWCVCTVAWVDSAMIYEGAQN